jgi:hypothetical protein
LITGGQNGSGAPGAPILQRWSGTGSTWTTLGTTTGGGGVSAVAELPNGDLVAGGQFTSMSGVACMNVARFDGINWSPLGSGISQSVVSLVVSPAGELLVLTTTSVFRWNGAAWVQVGLSQPGATALAFGADGSRILAGHFTGPDVLRWNGSFWAPLGSGSSGPVQSMAILPNGDVVVGPFVDASNPARPLERWNGTAWAPLGGTVDATVHALALALNGDLLLSGDFSVADGAVRCRFARVSTSCPATVLTQPGGCWYSSLAPVLVTNVLPWLGGTCRSTASNLPASSVAVIATGVAAASTLLSTVLPQASYGCTLLVAPDTLGLALPVAGRIEQAFPVPNVAALLGATVRQQVLSVTIDTTGTVSNVLASNALIFQLGSF